MKQKKPPLCSEIKEIELSDDLSVYFDKDGDLWIHQEDDTFLNLVVLKPEACLKLVKIINERIGSGLYGKIEGSNSVTNVK